MAAECWARNKPETILSVFLCPPFLCRIFLKTVGKSGQFQNRRGTPPHWSNSFLFSPLPLCPPVNSFPVSICPRPLWHKCPNLHVSSWKVFSLLQTLANQGRDIRRKGSCQVCILDGC